MSVEPNEDSNSVNVLTLVEADPRWKKVHIREQKEGWCGAGTLHVAMKYAHLFKKDTNSGFYTKFKVPTQEEINDQIYVDWYGAPNVLASAYLSRFFSDMGSKGNASLEDLYEHVNQGHIVIVDWWDDFPPPADGHYCIVAGYNRDMDTLTFVDTYGDRGIWHIDIERFEKQWFDYEGFQQQDGLKTIRWFMWLDPASLDFDCTTK